MDKKQIALVLIGLSLIFSNATGQDANKYHGGSFDGYAMGTSLGESYPMDYGDLPSAYNLTLKADNGAGHVSGTLYLGTGIDTETDGQEDAAAAGDDNNGDDEDGITVSGFWKEGIEGGAIQVTVTGGSGYLSGWIDWTEDNDFDDAFEQILDRRAVTAGTQILTFNIPSGVISTMQTYERFARFRLVPDNVLPLNLTGLVSNGEVEDYVLQFNGGHNADKFNGGSFDGYAMGTSLGESYPMDYGDLPSAYNLTLKADNGAGHVPGTLYLGTGIDTETDGQEDAAAAGDDNNGDDEDGITVSGPWKEGIEGGTIQVTVTGGSGYLSGWIDWTEDNDFDDAFEQILDRRAVTAGTQILTFNIPSGVISTMQTYERFARFRLVPDNVLPLNLTGLVSNGEVEDYVLQFSGGHSADKFNGGSFDGYAMGTSLGESYPMDYGDLPSAYNLTLKADNGAGHVPGMLYLGTGIDTETNGQEDAAAAGDDNNGDDEDGITVSGFWKEGIEGGAIQVTVTGGSGYLSGWIDWTEDNDFDDAFEQILDRRAVPAGTQTLTFNIPSGVISTMQTYERFARFRLAPDNVLPLNLTGLVSNGEVEDYVLQFSGGHNAGKFNGGSFDGYAMGTSGANISIPIPTVTTTAVSGITPTTASSGGNVTDDRGFPVTARGVCWSTSANPTTADSKTADGSGTGSFNISLTGLSSGTTYHVRAYATNSVGTSYGDDEAFTTLTTTPTVTTTAPNTITATTASSGGDLTSDGGLAVIGRGVCWSTSANPTTADNTTSDGTGTGSFTSSITGLDPNTAYHVRAYATNSAGTSYGSDEPFTTVTIPPTVTTDAATGAGSSGATLNGTVNANNDNTTVTFEYGTTTSYGNTVTADQSSVSGTTNTAVSKTISGLTNGITYHYRAVGVNSAGTVYGSDMTFETVDPTAPSVTTDATTGVGISGATLNGTVNANNDNTTVTFEYGTTTSYGNTVTADQSPVKGTTNSAVSKAITGLTNNTTYHYRTVGVNAYGAVNGSDMTFTTGIAVVTTTAVSSITSTTASSGGNVSADGGVSVTARGVCWSTSVNPTTADSKTMDGTGTGSFTSSLTGLSPGTAYFVRAYATNNTGTAYGNEFQFTTISTDFGDAPDPLNLTGGQYPTLLASNGAYHNIDSNLKLGILIDNDVDGQPGAASDGDDNDGTDDEDSVTDLSQLVLYKGVAPVFDLSLVNTTGSTATIKGWIDYNRNGIFEASESALTTAVNGATTAQLTFPPVPQTAPAATYARFRIATNGAEIADPTGMANDGEVEDYPVSIGGVQVVLMTPIGGEQLQGGSAQRIEWYSIPPGVGTIDLFCSFDGGQNYHDVIGTGLPNIGFHVWEVPAVNNQFCRVKIDVIGSLLASDHSAGNFTIDSKPPDVTMTNPTSGQTWYGGSTYDITWDATDNFGLGAESGESSANQEGGPVETSGSGPVSIQYSFDNWTSDKYYTICECEANDGHFAWTVPMSLVGSTLQLKVRVVDAAGNVTCGHHTGDIVIVGKPTPIQVTGPNGGETFAAGSSQKITWTSNVPSGKIDLYYSMDSGSTWPTEIAVGEVNDGSFDWTVPDINTQSLRIKAVLSGPVDQEDVSDQDLTVDGLAPTVELTSPSTGLTIEAGGSVEITWTAQDNFDLQEKPISLFYSTDGGTTFPNTIVQSVENNGKYTWNVPTDLNSSKVRLRVEAIDKAGLKASSSSKQNMTIAPLTLALTYPNGGEVFAGGETKTITWASTLDEGKVTLRYTTDGGKTWPYTIATNEANDGQFDWTMPGLNSQNVSLKITLQSAQIHEDQSNGAFTIDSTPPSIVLQSFTGGDSVEAGGKYEIRWKAEDNFGLKENAIAIRYSDDGGVTYPHTIAEDLENESVYNWTTPKHLNTDKVRIKIETTDEAGLESSNVSLSSFTVMPLIINITQPNGGELWNGMTLQTIKWTSNFNSGFVTLRYSTNGGQTWPHTIASGLENKLRKYVWEVPQINAEQVKVKAELSWQNQTSVESDHFEIQHHAPVVTIIYPVGGETWEANSTNEIRWTAEDSQFDLKDNPISILFSKDGGKTFNDSIAVKIKNDSLLYWTTPRDLNSSEVKIKVEAENVREVKGYDVIDENMAVLNPPPVITAIPDVSFENTGAAYFDLDPYVSDNNDRLIDINWSGWCEEPRIEIIINNENKWCTIIAREIAGLFDVILTATDPWGDSASDTLQIDVSGPTPVASPIVQSGPTEFVLEQNIPNPFNPQTTLRYGLPEDSEIQILVFNMAGKQVAELYNGHQSKGYHTVTWHALDQPTGVYFIRMMAKDFHDMKKCVLMK